MFWIWPVPFFETEAVVADVDDRGAVQQVAETYSHSINPTGLIGVVIPTADVARSVDDFCSSLTIRHLTSAARRFLVRSHSRICIPASKGEAEHPLAARSETPVTDEGKKLPHLRIVCK